ncbi:MAG: 2-isopropylmalate synthase [Alphaproteobacteria bacterium]|nr:2-isopropylmalate synthase [Alphaproteobacteria bacterium]
MEIILNDQTPQKYRPTAPVALPDRQWPSRSIAEAPRWLSSCLRDGNQAIFEPMDSDKKFEFFQMLKKIGFKEIEVAFPAASQMEFDFVRRLIEGGHIPDDMKIQVLTQARPDLIKRTMDSLAGAKQAIFHVYVATSPLFRDVVFNKSKEQVIEMAVSSVRQIRELAAQHPETDITLEFSPETFSQTELTFARDICDAVAAEWGATPHRKVIFNLPATVEVCQPNVYADMIEWMDRNLKNRDSVAISLHTHNDRGTAVAATELGLMAGADRVEGCLFGNGERTGNVDLVTMALNMQTQGVASGLDFSNLPEIVRTYERLTGMRVHERHPYAGDLVFTAFSGSHQDAIKKGFAKMAAWATGMKDGVARGVEWAMPYLLIDPRDIGRKLDNIIRINTQSGKGGISYVLNSTKGIDMPTRMQVEFSGVVQKEAEATKAEVSADDIWKAFQNEYVNVETPVKYAGHFLTAEHGNEPQGVGITLDYKGENVTLLGLGNGPIDGAIHALGLPIGVEYYKEQALGTGSNARAISVVELSIKGVPGTFYGAGVSENTVTASLQAILSGVNRAVAQGKLTLPDSYTDHPHVSEPQPRGAGVPRGDKPAVYAPNVA